MYWGALAGTAIQLEGNRVGGVGGGGGGRVAMLRDGDSGFVGSFSRGVGEVTYCTRCR